MWFRFFIISLINLIVETGVMVVFIANVLPEKTPIILITLTVWILSFLLAFLFALWAFSKRLPVRNDVLLLAGIHLLVAGFFYLTFGLFVSELGPKMLFTPEVLVQIALQIVAIFLSSVRMRRMKMKSVLGEGMTL